MKDLFADEEFLKLEKDYPLLKRARTLFDTPQSKPALYSLEELSYVVVDIETTGLDPAKHEIIEIAALKIREREIKEAFETLINPGRSIPPEIERITGINNALLEGKLSPREALTNFLGFVGTDLLVAHHTDFDIKFLDLHTRKLLEKPLTNESLCTLKIVRGLLPDLENHKLHTVANYFKIPIANRHRARGDAEITARIWLQLIERLKIKKVETLADLKKFIMLAEQNFVPF